MSFLKKLMGMGTSGSEAKKQEIRKIFDDRVTDGPTYATIAAMNMTTTKKLTEEVRTYYNYIIGYKDAEDPELVIIVTDHELSSFDEPVVCKKSECTKADFIEKTGSFSITHPAFGDKSLDFSIIASTAWGGYVISVSYVDEYTMFYDFFVNRFAK